MDQSRDDRAGAGLALGAWMAFLGVAIAALHQVGVGPPLGSPGRWTGWVSDSTGVEAAFALLRLLALGLTWYPW